MFQSRNGFRQSNRLTRVYIETTVMMPHLNGASANESNSDNRQGDELCWLVSWFAYLAGQYTTSPPFFTNPFMAKFLPQNTPNLTDTSNDRSSISPNSASPSPNDPYLIQTNGSAHKTDFRMNPLTGGYYLAPDQYQEMMQTYMQNLIIAAQSSNTPSNGLESNVG